MAKKKHPQKSSKQQDIKKTKATHKRIDRSLLKILLVGFIARLIYMASLRDNPFLGNYILDSLVLHTWATDILSGSSANLAFFRAPLYPYLLALIYKTFAVSPWPIIIVQNIFGLMTVVVSFFFARDLFGRKIALWSAWVVALYPTLIYFEGETMITTVAVFLYTLAAYTMSRAIESPQILRIVIAGLVFGLAAITRPTILPLATLFPLLVYFQAEKKEFKQVIRPTVFFLFALLLPILPVTLTNIIKGGEFVLISSQGGVNFYIGNSSTADGLTVIAPGQQRRVSQYEDNIWTTSVDEAEFRTERKMTQSEVSSFWFREALGEISDDIPHTIGLYAKKSYYFWHGQEIFNNKSLYFAGEYSTLMKLGMWRGWLAFPSGLLFPLMFVGAFVAWRKNNKSRLLSTFLISFSLVMSFFFVCSRFRQPIIPLAIILAVYGAHQLWQISKTNGKNSAIYWASLLALVIGLNIGGNVESSINRSQFHTILGSIYEQKNDSASAIKHFELAIDLEDQNVQVYDMLGRAYMGTGQTDMAERTYRKGVVLFPNYHMFHFGLGEIEKSRENLERAKYEFYMTLNAVKDFAPAFDRLGYIYQLENKIDSAVICYEALLEIQGSNPQLEAALEILRQQLDE